MPWDRSVVRVQSTEEHTCVGGCRGGAGMGKRKRQSRGRWHMGVCCRRKGQGGWRVLACAGCLEVQTHGT